MRYSAIASANCLPCSSAVCRSPSGSRRRRLEHDGSRCVCSDGRRLAEDARLPLQRRPRFAAPRSDKRGAATSFGRNRAQILEYSDGLVWFPHLLSRACPRAWAVSGGWTWRQCRTGSPRRAATAVSRHFGEIVVEPRRHQGITLPVPEHRLRTGSVSAGEQRRAKQVNAGIAVARRFGPRRPAHEGFSQGPSQWNPDQLPQAVAPRVRVGRAGRFREPQGTG